MNDLASNDFANFVLALFRLELRLLRPGAKPPSTKDVQETIDSEAKKEGYDATASVTKGPVTTAAPISTTASKVTTTTALPSTKPSTTASSSSSKSTATTPTPSSSTSLPATTLYPDDWYKAAAYLKSSMNQSADPCNQFFEYACGGYLQKHPLEPGQNDVAVFIDLQERAYRVVNASISQIDGPVAIPPFQKTKIVYDICTTTSQADSIKVISAQLDMYQGLPFITRNWNKTFMHQYVDRLAGQLWQKYNLGAVINPMVDVDVGGENVSQSALYLNQGSLMMGGPAYYLNSKLKNDTHDLLVSQLANLTSILIEHNKVKESTLSMTVEEFAEAMYAIELDFANITLAPDQMRNHSTLYNQFNVSQLDDVFPLRGFSWRNYLKFVVYQEADWVVDMDHYVIVAQMSYFEGLSRIFSTHQGENMVNYLLIRLLHSFGSEVAESNMEGARDCPRTMISLLPWSVGRLYVDASGFDDSIRSEVDEMVQELQSTLNNTMKSVNFLDTKSRGNAIRKATAILRNPGYPDWIMDDSKLTEFYKDFNLNPYELNWIGTYVALLSFNNAKQLQMLNEHVDRKNFLMSPALVNAWYQPEFNSISFPVAILQPPFFRPKGPKSLNFGAIGAVIGHELTHGFDDEGIQYDWNGALNLWMNMDSFKSFEYTAQCIVEEYDQFCYNGTNPLMCLNGKENQGENIADNGGVRQSYKAYEDWLRRHGERKLPGFEDFTHEQLFFIGYSSMWCSTETRAFDKRQILTNPHSPMSFRVLGTLKNLDEFATTFNCKASDKYDQPDNNRCYVWANPPKEKRVVELFLDYA